MPKTGFAGLPLRGILLSRPRRDPASWGAIAPHSRCVAAY